MLELELTLPIFPRPIHESWGDIVEVKNWTG
jgi:hypothetical protein